DIAGFFCARYGSYRFDSIPINASGVRTTASKQGWRPPCHGKRSCASSCTYVAGQEKLSSPGRPGRGTLSSMKRPKTFAASAADDSGLSNLRLSISLPGAAAKISTIRSTGRCGNKRSRAARLTARLLARSDLLLTSTPYVSGLLQALARSLEPADSRGQAHHL